MTKKSNIKKFLVFVVAVLAIAISVLIVNAAQTEEQVNETQSQVETAETNEESNISTYFHEASGTLIVSGTGVVEHIYPRAEGVDDMVGDPPLANEVIKVDTSVKHLVIDDGITAIHNSFNDLQNLKTVSFPDSLEEISESFQDCDKLTSLTFPRKLEFIYKISFFDCDKLTDINFSNAITIASGSFNSADALKEVYIPDNSVLSDSFSSCESLEKVVFGSGVKMEKNDEYGMPCFEGCNEKMVIVADKDDELSYKRAYIDYYGYNHYDKANFAYHSSLPERITATNEFEGIRLEWDSKYYVDTYYLYRKEKSDKDWTLLVETKANSYYDTSVRDGRDYVYMIKTNGSSENVTTDACFIETPKIVSAYNTTANTVKIKWNTVGGAVKYRIYRAPHSPTNVRDWEKIADVPAITTGDPTTNVFEDKTVREGESYRYTVRAFGKTTYSDYSNAGVSLIVLAMPKVESVANTDDGVKLAIKSGDRVYNVINKVYRKTTGGKWECIGFSYANDKIYIDKTAKSGVKYAYTVRASKSSTVAHETVSGLSAYDTKGKTITYLETPELSSATSTKTGVKLQWDKVEGASGYKVYRKTANSGWGEAIATVKGNSVVSYVDKTAKKGVTYTYTVRAYNGNTKSGYIAEGKTVKDKY